jgi:hypothetical protein
MRKIPREDLRYMTPGKADGRCRTRLRRRSTRTKRIPGM